MLKSAENVKSKGLDRVRNENVFPQTTLDKGFETNSRNEEKQTFLRNILQLILCDFLSKSIKIWLLVGGCVLTIKSKHFRDFLEISQFPKILSLESFGNS